MQLEGRKIAVVLGGGNGIGEATCHVMAERGWYPIPVDYVAEAAERVAKDLGTKGFQIDIRDLAGLERLAATIEAEIGPVATLVVSAGMVQERFKPQDFPMDIYRNVLAVNIEGTFNSCRAFSAGMLKRRSGSIVTIASTTGHMSSPLHAYGPSKAATISLTQTLAAEWGKSGVRVNSVSPGSTLVKRVLARPPGRYAGNVDDHMALGRRIQPREIAEGVEFLASDRASAITGIDLLIDAGLVTASGWGMYGGTPGPEQQGGAS